MRGFDLSDFYDGFTPEAVSDSANGLFETLVPELDALAKSLGEDFDSCATRNNYEDEVRRSIVSAYEKGVSKGLEEALYWKHKAKEEISDVISSVISSKRSMLTALEGELLKLSIAIAEKVVKSKIEDNVVECLKNQIESCLRQVGKEVPVQLRLNPEDVAAVRELLEDSESPFPMLNEVRLVEDRRVDRGGCILESEKGALRATINEQIEKISQVIEREYGKSVTEEVGSSPLGGT
ncbi:MAG: hypothetical protein B6D63_03525 [Candidatus Latescibacteria bacterium 4484_7]|nr:MAG: hypothetical protein B6D63_03525 [Candidatus Latescibacteria bacterium 4484_7]